MPQLSIMTKQQIRDIVSPVISKSAWNIDQAFKICHIIYNDRTRP